MEIRAQAELVTAWPEAMNYLDQPGRSPGVSIKVSNASKAAIYDVTMALSRAAIPSVEVNYPVIPPDHTELAALDPIQVVRLGIVFGSGPVGRDAQSTSAWALTRELGASISFTDSAGRRWVRDRTGALRHSETV